MIRHKFEVGDLLTDIVTGFSGAVMGITLYATGCLHYGLQATELKVDGTPHDWQWFDQSRLKLVVKDGMGSRVLFDIPEDTTSGPMPNAPQM